MGNEEVPENVLNTWRAQKNEFPRLQTAELRVVQGGKDDSEEKFNYVSELYEAKKAELLTKDERIRVLEAELADLSQNVSKQIPFAEVVSEARINYENLAGLSFAYQISTDFSRMDTIPVFEVRWKENSNRSQRNADTQRLQNWLRTRLKDSTVVLRITQ